jgi:flagellar biosynthesis anti-sigma factor FlgM
MVVDRYGVASANFSQQVQDQSLSTSATRSSSSAPATPAAEDTTSFTSATSSVQSLSQTAIQTIPSRQVKVETLRQAVNSAQYQLDTAKIAQALANSDI